MGAGSAEVSDDMVVEELDEGDAKAYKDIAKTLDKKEGFLKAAWKRIGERRGIDAVDFGEWDDDPQIESGATSRVNQNKKRGFFSRLLFGQDKNMSSSKDRSNTIDAPNQQNIMQNDNFVDEEAVDFDDSRNARLIMTNGARVNERKTTTNASDMLEASSRFDENEEEDEYEESEEDESEEEESEEDESEEEESEEEESEENLRNLRRRNLRRMNLRRINQRPKRFES